MRVKEVAFADERLKSSFEKLKTGKFEEKKIYSFIQRAVDDLKDDPFCGVRIPDRLIPRIYLEKFEINNIWKYDLPEGWRLIYSVTGDEVSIVSIILEWFDHKDYERRFSY